ncbi:lanthionine synthetase C family protein [Streptomyces sp. NPDC002795]|uniref:lanthionine synthetase C family protein n=1 Tax=Streptomyces sp. NPDC002795 TaxID=3364665 RepID=UPI0036BA18BA
MSDLHDLGRGRTGTLVHEAMTARASGQWEAVHQLAVTLTGQAVDANPVTASLYRGAPALAYALHSAHHKSYSTALSRLDDELAALVGRRLASARQRMDFGVPPRMREYDLISGLTGLGALLLYRRNQRRVLRDVLHYTVRLLRRPVRVGGRSVPGWWCSDAPSGRPDAGEWPYGHGNFGMAHGVAGPIALLALALRAGIEVPGQKEALLSGINLLERWARPLPGGGAVWPETLPLHAWEEGPTTTGRTGRPSWCYGTPGIARALQLAALTTHQLRSQLTAEKIVASCLADPSQLAKVQEASVCHGWAGLLLAAELTAADADPDSRINRHLHKIRAQFGLLLARGQIPGGAGLLTGADGVRLVGRTFDPIQPVDPGWATCLLLI